MKPIFTFLLIVFISLNSLMAQTFKVDSIVYEVISSVDPYTVEIISITPNYIGSIIIPGQVIYNDIVYTPTTIGIGAFSGCTGLKSIIIGNSVKTIESKAFSGCAGLTTVSLGASVTTIGDWAFSECIGLTSIEIPALVSNIGDAPFSYCSNMHSINVIDSNANFTSSEGILYNKDLTAIIYFPCTRTTITIPNSVTTISRFAFLSCKELSSIDIPNSVITINVGAFGFCKGLKSAKIGNSVVNISDGAFSNCTGLTSLTCNAFTPPNLGPHAFEYVPKDIPLYIPAASFDSYSIAFGWKEFTNILTNIVLIKSNEFSVYPNPVLGRLIVEGVSIGTLIYIYDIRGNEIYSKIAKGKTEQIDFNNLTMGVYIVKTNVNGYTMISKFLKR